MCVLLPSVTFVTFVPLNVDNLCDFCSQNVTFFRLNLVFSIKVSNTPCGEESSERKKSKKMKKKDTLHIYI